MSESGINALPDEFGMMHPTIRVFAKWTNTDEEVEKLLAEVEPRIEMGLAAIKESIEKHVPGVRVGYTTD